MILDEHNKICFVKHWFLQGSQIGECKNSLLAAFYISMTKIFHWNEGKSLLKNLCMKNATHSTLNRRPIKLFWVRFVGGKKSGYAKQKNFRRAGIL